MAVLTAIMKDAIASMEVVPFATASCDAIPNVVPVRFVYIEDNDTLWLVDNFFSKTLSNLENNPQVAIYVWSAALNVCYQFKGRVEIKTAGPEYERMRQKVLAVRPDLPAKSLVIVHLTYVYNCLPGPTAGDRLSS